MLIECFVSLIYCDFFYYISHVIQYLFRIEKYLLTVRNTIVMCFKYDVRDKFKMIVSPE